MAWLLLLAISFGGANLQEVGAVKRGSNHFHEVYDNNGDELSVSYYSGDSDEDENAGAYLSHDYQSWTGQRQKEILAGPARPAQRGSRAGTGLERAGPVRRSVSAESAPHQQESRAGTSLQRAEPVRRSVSAESAPLYSDCRFWVGASEQALKLRRKKLARKHRVFYFWDNNKQVSSQGQMGKGGILWFFSFNVRCSTLLHLPALRFHCVGGC
jgi:hypothetical protein